MNENTSLVTPEHRRAVAVPGHPGIFKKGSRYQVRWRYYSQQKCDSFRTLTEAKRFQGKVRSGDAKPESAQPFKRYAVAWIDSYKGRTGKGINERTRESYADAITRQAIPYFKTMPLGKIDPKALRGYVNHLADQDLAPASVARAFAPLKALLATAAEDGLISANPALGVRVIVADNRDKKPKVLTPGQTKALLTEMPEEHADFAYLLAATGCRISEALAARWQDVAPSADGRPSLVIPESKTEAGTRTLPLSPETARRLTLRHTKARYSGLGDLIFPTTTGQRMDDHNYRRRIFNPAAERAGVPWATPHKLRHGMATLMADHGYSAEQIAAHLGHADGGVLAQRVYIHAKPLAEVDFLDAALAV